jgi:glycine/D-amino acid oxidase-like deaminating enzyme
MSATHKVLVVGAGIFGTSAALELQRRGHSVTLVDPGPLPHPQAASTDISKMIRMDYGADVFYTELMERAIQGWQSWNRRWGRKLYHQVGFLLLARQPLAPGGFEFESMSLLAARGHAVTRLRPESLAEYHPAWSSAVYPDGYFNPNAGYAESAEVVASLLEEAAEAGVVIRAGVRCAGFFEDDGRVRGIRTAKGDRMAADAVIVACGAWTPALVPGLEQVMWPVAQPVLHFLAPEVAAFQPPRFPPWAADISQTGWYGFPARDDGTLKIANHGPGRRHPPDAPRSATPQDEARFRAFLSQSLPALAQAPLIGQRLCLYCDTWDGDFWIDHHPGMPGLLVAAGGSGNAFKFAPLLGGLIADVMEGRENPAAWRFRWRRPGQAKSEAARAQG